jgi:hypothetical protein
VQDYRSGVIVLLINYGKVYEDLGINHHFGRADRSIWTVIIDWQAWDYLITRA